MHPCWHAALISSQHAARSTSADVNRQIVMRNPCWLLMSYVAVLTHETSLGALAMIPEHVPKLAARRPTSRRSMATCR
jgi:hypothetical protein